jgi:UDP-N-acetylmuramate dehydrogenase
MSFLDIVVALRSTMPALRGRLLANQSLAELTWFRVGGPAQVLFMPEDEDDLRYFLARTPADIAVTAIGLGSNLIVRDGGIAGVVVRLGRGFNEVAIEGTRVRAGTAVPDVKVARAAQEAGIAGLSFLRGIPGSIGGALRMNGGAYGGEVKDVLVEARGVDRRRRRDLHPGCVARRARRRRRHCRRDEQNHREPRVDAAGKKPHRRFHFQKSPGP